MTDLFFPAGGYLTGGGTGRNMRRFGWAADNILSAKVVFPDGTIGVAADPATVAGRRLAQTAVGQPVAPADLLWAIRGGGAGTAVVYEFTVKLYDGPASNVVVCSKNWNFGGNLVTRKANFVQWSDALFSAWQPWTLPSSINQVA